MVSIRQIASCIGLSGNLSIIGDFFGYTRVPSGAPLSLLTQVRRLQQRHIHLNLIRVGIESLIATEGIMATLAVRDIVSRCLGKSGSLSVKEDVFGVYGNNNQNRSLRDQIHLIQDRPFVRLALVTIQGALPNLQRDLDNANTIYQNECDAWVYCQASISIDRPDLLILDQDDCSGDGHSVSDEEDELFDLGRDLGADIVGYYIDSSSGGFAGCAAHPPGRRGFWVGSLASPWTFAHELTHVLLDEQGDTEHVLDDSDNLMFTPTANITNPPPDLTSSQSDDINNDPDMERCRSSVD
jgi:hypothetical protein